MLNKQNLDNDFYYENENSYDEEDRDYYFDSSPELSNDELDFISENYKGRYIGNTIKNTKSVYPLLSFKNLKNTSSLKMKYLKKETPEQKPFVKKIVESKKRTCVWVKKEINNKIKNVLFKENEYPILEAGNTKIKIQECKKEADSWFHVEKKKKTVELEEKNKVIPNPIPNPISNHKKDMINKCYFDNECRNIKRLNDGIYINKHTNKKCKYLHSYETIKNYNDRMVTSNNIEIKEIVKNKVMPILKVFSKIENPWSIKTITTPLIVEKEIEKIIFIKAPKSLETHILNMSKNNGYNIQLSIY